MRSIHDLLEVALQRKASDLVIKADAKPAIRVNGKMQFVEAPAIAAGHARELIYEILFSANRDRMIDLAHLDEPGELHEDDSETQLKALEQKHELDLVFTIPNMARVRANLFMERGHIGAVLRIIPLRPQTIEELGLPPILKKIAMEPQGLIIITGPTGSGKTTTLAALIEEINRNKNANIFTIEEPVEYLFEDKQSVIHQREVGADTHSFESALHSVTRQSPDVIAIGELRDRKAMDVAMTAAEIGHLVITTLHTTSAASTIDRIVNSFPEHLKRQTCRHLSASLLCVTSQRLVNREDGAGRVPAVEIMTASPSVKKLLEDGETADLHVCLRDGSHFNMNTMNQALERLCQSQTISYDDALQFSGNPAELRQMLRRG